MMCPTCSKPSVVIATFQHDEANVKRRRKCLGNPSHRFNTWEVASDISASELPTAALKTFALRLANRGFTKEAIESILSLE